LKHDVDRLLTACNEEATGREKAEAELKALTEQKPSVSMDSILALLKVAKCPNCDGCGFTIYETGGIDMDGENDTRECHQEKCRWCDERDAIRGEEGK